MSLDLKNTQTSGPAYQISDRIFQATLIYSQKDGAVTQALDQTVRWQVPAGGEGDHTDEKHADSCPQHLQPAGWHRATHSGSKVAQQAVHGAAGQEVDHLDGWDGQSWVPAVASAEWCWWQHQEKKVDGEGAADRQEEEQLVRREEEQDPDAEVGQEEERPEDEAEEDDPETAGRICGGEEGEVGVSLRNNRGKV